MLGNVGLALAFAVACCFVVVPTYAWDDYDIQSVNSFNGSEPPMEFEIKYKRINRTTYGMTGAVSFSALDTIESELLIYHQAKGSSKFVLTPYKLPRGSICESLNKDYRKFLMHDLHPYSNLPFSEDQMEDICPQFQGTKFEVKDFIMTEKTIPESMEYGTYKVQGFIFDGDKLANGIEFLIKLY